MCPKVLITADYSFSVQKKYHNLQVADNAGLNTYVVAVAKQSDSFWVKKVRLETKMQNDSVGMETFDSFLYQAKRFY